MFYLELDQSTRLTFICENATEFDLQVIMFEWWVYETFGNKSFLYEPNPRELQYLIEYENSNYIIGKRVVDVKSQCR